MPLPLVAELFFVIVAAFNSDSRVNLLHFSYDCMFSFCFSVLLQMMIPFLLKRIFFILIFITQDKLLCQEPFTVEAFIN